MIGAFFTWLSQKQNLFTTDKATHAREAAVACKCEWWNSALPRISAWFDLLRKTCWSAESACRNLCPTTTNQPLVHSPRQHFPQTWNWVWGLYWLHLLLHQVWPSTQASKDDKSYPKFFAAVCSWWSVLANSSKVKIPAWVKILREDHGGAVCYNNMQKPTECASWTTAEHNAQKETDKARAASSGFAENDKYLAIPQTGSESDKTAFSS